MIGNKSVGNMKQSDLIAAATAVAKECDAKGLTNTSCALRQLINELEAYPEENKLSGTVEGLRSFVEIHAAETTVTETERCAVFERLARQH